VRVETRGIVNLDDARSPGTHWVAYAKRDNHVIYFDNFGNLRPPKELVRYFGNGVTKIEYNRTIPIKSIIRASVDNCVCNFFERSMCTKLKSDSALSIHQTVFRLCR